MLCKNSLFSSVKRHLQTPLACVIQLTFWALVPFLTLIYHHGRMEQLQLARASMEQMHERLQHLGNYDLRSLASAGSDRLNLLQRISIKENQTIKFTSEVAVEDRRVRERPLSMQQALAVDSVSLLKILDILQPPAQEKPSADLWVKLMKIRRDRAGFTLQLSLLKRELKS